MAQNANQLFVEQSYGALLRCHSKSTRSKTFAASASAPLLAKLTPLAFNKVTEKWVPWLSGAGTEVQTLNLGAASAGTFTISFDGETTAAIAFNATAAAVQAALELLSNIDPGDVVVTGGPLPATITLTFGGNLANKDIPAITVDGGSTTGETITITTSNAGANNGIDKIRAFVWPETVQLHATDEVLGTVCLAGAIHYADIPLFSTNTANQLKAALREGMRELGFTIDGLDKVR